VLVSHVLVPPAISAIASSPVSRVDGFLAAGHVCSVMGTWQYGPLVEQYGLPIVVTGFEPLDVLDGIRRVVVQLEAGRPVSRTRTPGRQRPGQRAGAAGMIDDVFEVCDRQWRGIGMIPASGWRLSSRYAAFDAELRFGVDGIDTPESSVCRAGEVLQGLIKPNECEAFGTTCTPRNPLGATMVSSEGACAAYYQYRRLDTVPVSIGVG
jgi:hydrogenase expression/formation protein HypD